ncbi:MAG: hypothetical protein Kow0032_27850 [Methyloligellaceae bacterium]
MNISLPAEFAAARDWLTTLGDPDDVSVVPGNHDAYVRMDHKIGLGLWHEFMQPDMAHGIDHPRTASGFPYIRIRGMVALVGLSTAVPSRPFIASGRLDRTQLDALPVILRALRERALFRVILIHHPPLPGMASRYRGLVDAEALVPLLQSEGAELVLYGHNHDQAVHFLDTRTGRTPVVGVPSASVALAERKPLARYNLFRIGGDAEAGWSCQLIGRGLPPRGAGGSPVTELERLTLSE